MKPEDQLLGGEIDRERQRAGDEQRHVEPPGVYARGSRNTSGREVGVGRRTGARHRLRGARSTTTTYSSDENYLI
jgi:hypothetical protein